MPLEEDLPDTLKRSDKHAQEIFLETLDNANQEYGHGARAHRVAYASLKHSYKKVGDHWEPKDRQNS